MEYCEDRAAVLPDDARSDTTRNMATKTETGLNNQTIRAITIHYDGDAVMIEMTAQPTSRRFVQAPVRSFGRR